MAALATMSEEPPSDPLARLGERIDEAQAKARAGRGPAQKSGGTPGLQQGLALGLRIGVELVTAVVVSVALGWAIDRWLGTRPWVMLVMFFLGIAAGMLNVYRATWSRAMSAMKACRISRLSSLCSRLFCSPICWL
jgi:ATP synthase protein I